MTNEPHAIDVTGKGTVLLGKAVSCDGCRSDRPYRVQSHTHKDHMGGFDDSKSMQRAILMSESTRSLLIAEYDADLPYRNNVIGLALSITYSFDECDITLESSGHTLDAVQTLVEYKDGLRLGYSGDFAWPIDKVIEIDELVVDSTNGNPGSIRTYTQQEIDEKFSDLIVSRIRYGSIVVQAHRGTIERAAAILDQVCMVPVLVSNQHIRELEVYEAFGYPVGNYLELESEIGQRISQNGIYVLLKSLRTSTNFPYQPNVETTITLSAAMANPKSPMEERTINGKTSYRLSMSNHADFNGTIEYIKATGARYVVTDNSGGRGGKAVDLANFVKYSLGIESRPSSGEFSPFWGF